MPGWDAYPIRSHRGEFWGVLVTLNTDLESGMSGSVCRGQGDRADGKRSRPAQVPHPARGGHPFQQIDCQSIAIASLVNLFNPSMVVVGGGVPRLGIYSSNQSDQL